MGPPNVTPLSNRRGVFAPSAMLGLAASARAGTPASNCAFNAGFDATLSPSREWFVPWNMADPDNLFVPVFVIRFIKTPPLP